MRVRVAAGDSVGLIRALIFDSPRMRKNKTMRKTRLSFLCEFLQHNGDTPFTEEQLKDWFRLNTDYRDNSIHMLRLNCTTNVVRNRNRTWRYGEKGYNLLFQLPDGKHYRQYDPGSDPLPIVS